MRLGHRRRTRSEEEAQRSGALEVLDLMLNDIGERKASPTEAISLVTLAMQAFAEEAVERRLVCVLWKLVGQ